MKIETKFDYNDTIYFMYNDKIHSGTICGVTVTKLNGDIKGSEEQESYHIKLSNDNLHFRTNNRDILYESVKEVKDNIKIIS